MLALSKLLIENKALMIAAGAVAFFVAAVLILLVFRLAFGRRLRMPGGRARQMRLGIVDAFDLDRQRQLVIVRRDNVEHLVMIGGPNDILIESQIIRTEARGRDKEIREREPSHLPAPSAKPHAVEPKLAIPPLVPEPQPVAAAEDHIAHAPAHAAAARLPGVAPTGPTSPPPTAAPAPRRSQPAGPAPAPLAAPLAPASVKPQPVHEAPAGEGELLGKPQMPKPPVGPTQPQPAGQGQAPTFLRWPARPGPTPPTPPQPKPAGPSPTPSARPPIAPERPAGGPPVPSVEGLESLEEEMAKLLGRGPSKP